MRITTTLAIVLLMGACQPTAPQVTAPQADAETPMVDPQAATPETQATKTLPVTTTSKEALAAYEAGLIFGDNFDVPQAIASFTKAIELDADFISARAALAQMMPGNEGLDMLQKAHDDAAKLPEAERLHIEAELASRLGESDRSDELTMKVAAMAPGDFRLQLAVSSIHMANDDFASALAATVHATELQPLSGGAWNRRAYAHAMLGQHDQSIEAVDRYVKLEPSSANPHDTRGDLLLMAGRLEESEASFAQALLVEDAFFYALNGVAQTRFLRGDWDGGREALTRARAMMTRSHDLAEADTHIAWSHHAQGDHAAADKVLTEAEAAAKASDVGGVYAWLAITRAKMAMLSGQHEAAMTYAATGLARLDEVSVKGAGRVGLELTAEWIAVMSLAGSGQSDEAGRRLASLTESAAHHSYMKGQLTNAQAAIAISRDDAAGAIKLLSPCSVTSLECSLLLAQAHRATGDEAAAVQALSGIRSRHYRAPQYLGIYKAAGGGAHTSMAK
ncbi:MAG: tetratricopeptide (TPR) repeat protein [Kiritimatiellia bacterium]|jgi:tetratricopeptide (TPR) repeat protein